ncbi:collagen alpha-1(III) chain-like [Anoplophora glabripennis]|uniref:collagen alpha-1(III) chain-like n=1 Tax=Anoplophora glabripennis TaxID=217634 RepID=UPI0008736ACB|nr:collagen alpha-1(III) chain-like [Anoplophora glabripennis]
MKLPYITVAILATSLLVGGILADEKIIRKRTRRSNRVARQTSADQMVQNILKWLQGVYTQQSRRIRQGTLREYLPPTNTQKPRPFETARPPGNDQNGNYIYGGYPPAGSITPQPPFPIFTRPPSGGVPGEGYPSTVGYPHTTFPGQGTPARPSGYPTETAGTSGPESYPTPGFPTHAPDGPTPGEYPGGHTAPGGFTGYPDGQPTPGGTTGHPGGETTPGFTGYPGAHTTPGGVTGSPGTQTTPGGFTGYPGGPSTPGGFTGPPDSHTTPGGFTGYPGGQTTPGGFTGYPGSQTTPGGFTGYPGGQTTPGGFTGPPGGQPTPGDFTGTPGGQTTPGDITGYPGSQTTPGGFTGLPDGQTTPAVPTEASTQPPITSAPPEKPGFPTRPPPAFTGYPEGPGLSTQPPPELTSALPGFPTQPPPGAFTGYPTRLPDVTDATTQPELTRIPTQAPEATVPPQQPEATESASEKPEGTEAPSEKTEGTEGPVQPEGTEAPVQPEGPEAPTSGRPVLSTEPSVVETESPTSKPSTSPPLTETFTSATSPEEQPPAGEPTTQSPEINTIPTGRPEKPGDTEPVETDSEDLKHPPHIHAIDVECAKDMMTINLEFNREFNGIIYSKGYYNMPECRYVKENSGQKKYTFTVNLNQCGTEFINAFDTQGQSYLENVLVLQNEAGVQEIWDTVRAVRCLWEGNLKETLSVALSVGMLSQELVTFSGDTAVAKLDILLGRGALGQPANGLVKIGEPMTLVVSVSGDPGFDLQVKDCRATDSTGDNTIPLTDDDGCVLKPKLFGAFQKTRSTGDTGASIIAYAYFNAFKFPDVMDLMIECNIELCKTDCDMCTDPNQKLEPGRRRRRDLYTYNETLHDGVTMGKHLRIILPEDLNLNDRTVIDLGRNDGVCMSTQSFVFSTALLISLLTASCLFSAYMWLKTQQLKFIKK